MTSSGRIRSLLAAIPRFLQLLIRLIGDSRVSPTDKALLAGAVAYTLAPLDLVPDFIPVLGQLDDLLFLALAIDRMVSRAGLALLQEHWDGPQEVLLMLCGSLDDLSQRLPEPVRRRLTREVEGR